MTQQRKSQNASVVRGAWGEAVAVQMLRREGLVVVERNVRPCPWNRRLEIDVIAYEKKTDTIVFVEVKMHARLSARQRRLRSVNAQKLSNLKKACNAWRRINSYFGGVRFDVIEIYGDPQVGEPEIDHIRNVNLFVKREKFVKWKKEKEKVK
ncbi:MAG: YraN family protein [Kiritimatiellae bacterium]|nr:YraN family protein [Kiritimatiellia bacterium]